MVTMIVEYLNNINLIKYHILFIMGIVIVFWFWLRVFSYSF